MDDDIDKMFEMERVRLGCEYFARKLAARLNDDLKNDPLFKGLPLEVRQSLFPQDPHQSPVYVVRVYGGGDNADAMIGADGFVHAGEEYQANFLRYDLNNAEDLNYWLQRNDEFHPPPPVPQKIWPERIRMDEVVQAIRTTMINNGIRNPEPGN